MRRGPFAQYAAHMLEGGYSPLPIRVGTKRPLFNEWDHLRAKAMLPEEISRLARNNPGLGLGVAGGFNCLVPVDIDTENEEIRAAILGALPQIVVSKVGQRGLTVFYWDPSGLVDAAKFKRPLGGGKFDMLVEIINTGQTVLPPTIHPDTQKPYRWLTQDTLFNTRVDELPQISLDHIEAMKKALAQWMPEQRQFEPKPVAHNVGPASSRRYASYARAIIARESANLGSMGPKSGRNQRLFAVGCILGKFIHHKIISYTEVENAMMAACQANGLWSEDGEHACKASLGSGVRRARNDELPLLENRERVAA